MSKLPSPPLLVLILLGSLVLFRASRAQTLAVSGDRFLLDGQPTDLWGIRVASATQSDSLTNHLIANLDDYRAHGINALSVFLQGSSGGFGDPFRQGGKSLDPAHLKRLIRLAEACRERSMVLVLGIFYQRVIDNQNGTRRLHTREEIVRAVETTVEVLRPYRHVILNIANEQNSHLYRRFATFGFNDPQNIIALCRRAKEADPDRIVGAGGYLDSANVVIGRSRWVDVLLFDTSSQDVARGHDSGWHHGYFRDNGVVGKPMVNVEIFGAWSTQFVPPGVYPEESKEIHWQEIAAAKARPGLSVFFHSNPWCQGPADGFPVRYDLGGDGTAESPGIRWYFERIAH